MDPSCTCGFSPTDTRMTVAAIACDRFTAHVRERLVTAVRVASNEMNRDQDDILLYGTNEPDR